MESQVPVTADRERMLGAYRAAREALLPQMRFDFPAGCLVRLRGVASGAWDGVVLDLDQASQRSMSADMVMVKFGNGNRFPVAVDELERRCHRCNGTGEGDNSPNLNCPKCDGSGAAA